MIQEQATILWNRKKGPGYFSMGLSCSGYTTATPGQFVMVRVSQQDAPLLRRPFSIHRPVMKEGHIVGIELLYKVVGTGTELLSRTPDGTVLDVLGPIGNGFSVPEDCRSAYLVGGGIGVPPLVFLASALKKAGMDMSGCRMFLGGRSSEDLLCRDDFEALGISVRCTTDDGSAGDHCLVTHPLEMATATFPPDIIYACGPLPMLACIVGISDKYKIPCQVSIESMMACGMGACLGCAVEKRGDTESYWHVCKDGPVFDAKQLVL
jgi:dihydroorotate dehydrogenase electron transfer subunit